MITSDRLTHDGAPTFADRLRAVRHRTGGTPPDDRLHLTQLADRVHIALGGLIDLSPAEIAWVIDEACAQVRVGLLAGRAVRLPELGTFSRIAGGGVRYEAERELLDLLGGGA